MTLRELWGKQREAWRDARPHSFFSGSQSCSPHRSIIIFSDLGNLMERSAEPTWSAPSWRGPGMSWLTHEGSHLGLMEASERCSCFYTNGSDLEL
jgi:hypothetical protein